MTSTVFTASGRGLAPQCGTCGASFATHIAPAACPVCGASDIGWRVRDAEGNSAPVTDEQRSAVRFREQALENMAQHFPAIVRMLPAQPSSRVQAELDQITRWQSERAHMAGVQAELDRLKATRAPPSPVIVKRTSPWWSVGWLSLGAVLAGGISAAGPMRGSENTEAQARAVESVTEPPAAKSAQTVVRDKAIEERDAKLRQAEALQLQAVEREKQLEIELAEERGVRKASTVAVTSQCKRDVWVALAYESGAGPLLATGWWRVDASKRQLLKVAGMKPDAKRFWMHVQGGAVAAGLARGDAQFPVADGQFRFFPDHAGREANVRQESFVECASDSAPVITCP